MRLASLYVWYVLLVGNALVLLLLSHSAGFGLALTIALPVVVTGAAVFCLERARPARCRGEPSRAGEPGSASEGFGETLSQRVARVPQAQDPQFDERGFPAQRPVLNAGALEVAHRRGNQREAHAAGNEPDHGLHLSRVLSDPRRETE